MQGAMQAAAAAASSPSSSSSAVAAAVGRSRSPSPTRALGWQLKYLYDGDCPMCQSLMNVLKRQDNSRGLIEFVNIADDAYNPRNHMGITYEEAMTTIHALRPDGTIVQVSSWGWGWGWGWGSGLTWLGRNKASGRAEVFVACSGLMAPSCRSATGVGMGWGWVWRWRWLAGNKASARAKATMTCSCTVARWRSQCTSEQPLG